MKEILYFLALQSYIARGLSVREAHEQLYRDYNAYPHPSAKKLIDIINKASRDDGIDPDIRPNGLNVTLITDPAQVEQRKRLSEQVWQVFFASHERQTTQNKNYPQIDRDLQRLRNRAIPGREEEIVRVFGSGSKATMDEKRQLYTDYMLELLDFDWDEAVRSKTDSELVAYYSNPDNFTRLQIIIVSEAYIDMCKKYQVDKSITDALIEVNTKLMARCTNDLNRLEMISTNVYKNCDPVELFKDSKGLEFFRAAENVAPFLKANEADITLPPQWGTRGSAFSSDMASIIDYCSFGGACLLDEKLNRMMSVLRGKTLTEAAQNGDLVKIPDMKAYYSHDQFLEDCVDGTSFFVPNAEDPDISALVTITRGGNVKWGYCSKQSFDIMAKSPKDALMEWVNGMTPFDETVFPGNEDMYIQKHGLSQEERSNLISRNNIEKELTQLSLKSTAPLRDKLALRDKTVAELAKTINQHRDQITESFNKRDSLSVFKFRSDLSEHLANVYVNYLVLQQIEAKGDTITADEIKDLINKDFVAESIEAVRKTPGFMNFVETAEIGDLEALTDKSSGTYSNKALADMKNTIEGKISGYVKLAEVQPQNDKEKILRWYRSLEDTLRLQGVDINNPADRMRVISSDVTYTPDAPGDTNNALSLDYYAFMDRKVNEDGSLGDYAVPKPSPSKDDQTKVFEPMLLSYKNAVHDLDVAYLAYDEAKKANRPQKEIDTLLSRLDECNDKCLDAKNAYTKYWDNLIAPTNKWLMEGTRKFDPENPEDFKFIENLYNSSKDGFLRLQTLGRNSRSMIQIGVGKDGLAKTGVNLLEIPDEDADPYGSIKRDIAYYRSGDPRYAHLVGYDKLSPLKRVPEELADDPNAITVVTEANRIIESQYDDFLRSRFDKYYPDVENSVKMVNALAVISQNNFMIPPSDGTYGSWNEMYYVEYMRHFNIFANEMHYNPASYDANGMRKPEISDKFRMEHIFTEEEKNLNELGDQALFTKMVNDVTRPYKASELEEMKSKNEELRAAAENSKLERLNAKKQDLFSDKPWAAVSTKDLMKKIGDIYGKKSGFGSKIFTVACMKNQVYNKEGALIDNALTDIETLNDINRLISIATGDGKINEKDRAFLNDLEARAQGPVSLSRAFDSMVSMLYSTMDFEHDVKDITSPGQAYIASVFLELHTRYPDIDINGKLVLVNGQDCSLSHPDDRQAYLELGSQISGLQNAYAELNSKIQSLQKDEPADLSIKRGRDILLEGQAAPNIPSIKDYMTFVRKEIKENSYFNAPFEEISKYYENYEYDKFKAKMNFDRWVKEEKVKLLKHDNDGAKRFLTYKAKLAAKQRIITEILRGIVGEEKDITKAIDYFAQSTDSNFQLAYANFGTYCDTLKKYPDRVDELLNLGFESYRAINPNNHTIMQLEELNKENCRVESYMRDLFDVDPGDGSGMFYPVDEGNAREYKAWHQDAMAVKMEVPDKYKDIANFVVMGSFFSHEIMNDEWIKAYSTAGGSSGFLRTYDSALSNFFDCTITGDARANMQIIRKNEKAAREMANRIMASEDPNQVKEALRTAARTLFENIRLQDKTLKDEYRVAQKYLNDLSDKAEAMGLHDEDLGITPEMREKINLYNNIAKVNRSRIEAVQKVQRLYRDNFFTGEDISDSPELKEAAARAHGSNKLLMTLLTEFKSKKLVHDNEIYFIDSFKGSYDEEARVEINERAHTTQLSAFEKAFNENPDEFIKKYTESAKADIEKDYSSAKLEIRLNKVLKAPDPAITTTMDICSPKEFLLSMGMLERNARFFDAGNPLIANEMRSISEEANRYLTEDGAFNELNINQLMQRIRILGKAAEIKGKPKNEEEFYLDQLHSAVKGFEQFKKQADAYKESIANIAEIMGVPVEKYSAQIPAPSQITERGVFRIGESIPENYSLNTMLNELKQVSLIRGSEEFKALSDSIKELRSFAGRNGDFLGNASKCEEFKERLSLVSNAAGIYADKKSSDPDIFNADTNSFKRFHFAQRVLRATNVMERRLTQVMMHNLEHNAAGNLAVNVENLAREFNPGQARII